MPSQVETSQIHYVSDSEGKAISVIVPIELWQEIQRGLRQPHDETDYLLASETMKQRLLEAKGRSEGISLEDARARLGI